MNMNCCSPNTIRKPTNAVRDNSANRKARDMLKERKCKPGVYVSFCIAL